MPSLTVAEELLYSTVKLTAFKNGSSVSTGTGFFFGFGANAQGSVPCIVTNKHVVNGADLIRIRCHLATDQQPSGEFIDCDFQLIDGMVCGHPSSDIDLCVLPFGRVLLNAERSGKKIFFRMFNSSSLPEGDEWEYFDAIEEVIMTGCPNGISDQINNLPITRRGITATSLAKNYNGKPEFMVDMACFPGSSGSPIFLYNRDGYLDRKANTYMMGRARLKLVGVLYSGPLIQNNGTVVLSHEPRVQVASMMHLGHAIKSSELRVLEEAILAVAGARPSVSPTA